MPFEIKHVVGSLLVMRDVSSSLPLQVSRLPRASAVTPDLAERFTKYLPNEEDANGGLKESLDGLLGDIITGDISISHVPSFNPTHKQEK